MKKGILSRVSWVLTSVFAALMLFACGHAVVIGPGPGIPGTPTAVASANPPTGDSPVTVTLSAAGSTDPDGKIVRWQWDFENDGTYDWSSTTSGTVTHEYPAGEYTAKLLVTDDSGKSAVATVTNIFSNPAHLNWTFETVASWDGSGYVAGKSFVFINPITHLPSIVYGTPKGIAFATSDDSGNWNSEEYDLPLIDITEPVFFSDGSFGLGVHTREVSGNIAFLERSAAGVWSLNRIDTVSSSNPSWIHLAYDTGGDIYLMYFTGTRSSEAYRIAAYSDSAWTINEAGINTTGLSGLQAFTCFAGNLYAAFTENGKILTVYVRNQGNWQVDTRIDQYGQLACAELKDIAGTLVLFESESLPSRLTSWRKSSSGWAMTDLTGVIPIKESPGHGMNRLHAFENGSTVSLAFTTSNWVCYVADIADPSLERFAYDSSPLSVHAVYGDNHNTYLCYSGNWKKEVILAIKK